MIFIIIGLQYSNIMESSTVFLSFDYGKHIWYPAGISSSMNPVMIVYKATPVDFVRIECW